MKFFLSTICILLFALFTYQVMSFPLDVSNTQHPDLDNELANSINYDLPQLAVLNQIDKYSEIVQRPLFVKDRAAAVVASPQVVNKTTTVDELSHLVLVGTASSTDVQIAIVADTKEKKMQRLKAGESYKDWSIAEVSTDHVVFQNDGMEYKLFVTPIEGSSKDKREKLLRQVSKSKIETSSTANMPYKGWQGANKNNSNTGSSEQKAAGKIWNYEKYEAQDKTKVKDSNNSKVNNKPVKKSPIKIPEEEEKSAAYYEGIEDEDEKSTATITGHESTAREISVEDYYDDEDITEDELKTLEGLGAKIFDD